MNKDILKLVELPSNRAILIYRCIVVVSIIVLFIK
jgi:hypothetical protein